MGKNGHLFSKPTVQTYPYAHYEKHNRKNSHERSNNSLDYIKKEKFSFQEVKRLDTLASHMPKDIIGKQLLETKYELVLNKKNEDNFLRLGQQHFEYGNKTGKP